MLNEKRLREEIEKATTANSERETQTSREWRESVPDGEDVEGVGRLQQEIESWFLRDYGARHLSPSLSPPLSLSLSLSLSSASYPLPIFFLVDTKNERMSARGWKRQRRRERKRERNLG